MIGQVSKQTKHDRSRELAAVEIELRTFYYSKLKGMRLRVLVESPLDESKFRQAGASARLNSPQDLSPATFIGTSCRYAPVEIACTEAQLGQFVDVVAGPPRIGRLTTIQK
jgi:hypothetical protein